MAGDVGRTDASTRQNASSRNARQQDIIVVISFCFISLCFGHGSGRAQTAQESLEKLSFKNSGIVTRTMDFRYFHQPDDYLETPDLWSISNDGIYLYQVTDGKKTTPPDGMRSSVPLGGLGSGTVELRADGSFQDWNIFNNSPAYGDKIKLDDALFAIHTNQADGKTFVSALRTAPPNGLRAIGQIEYSGDFPVSRLRFTDAEMPVSVDLYAYSEFRPGDADASCTPAAIFTFLVKNPSKSIIDASIFFLLPNHIDGHADVSHGLTFLRDGKLPLSGSVTLRATGSNVLSEAATASDFMTLWKAFSAGQPIGRNAMDGEAPRYGAATASIRLKPGETQAVTFILAWYLPNRPFLTENAGNYYAAIYTGADDVLEKVAARLPDDWRSLLEWQRVMQENSLPDWLQDSLINSVATTYKTGMRFRDGRWRQWEAFSCADGDPGHIDFYDALPYMFFFPALRKQVLTRFAAAQQDDGFIPEVLITGGVPKSVLPAAGPLDMPGGRTMGDSATIFVLGVWQYYHWTGDEDFLRRMWPHVRLAALWQIERSKHLGLPEYLQTTYDLFNFDRKTLVSYNAILQLASLLAAEKIANISNDPRSAEQFRAAFRTGQEALTSKFWTGEYFRAWWSDDGTSSDTLLADTLYGQLWASLLDLGPVTEKRQLTSHLESEAALNGNPYGLRVLSGREIPAHRGETATNPWKQGDPKPNDALIWPAGSLDWSALTILLGGHATDGLTEAKKVIANQSTHLQDQWNYTDLNNNWDGAPWGNSHYTRQLIQWALPLAISGQEWDAAAKKLAFHPAAGAPDRLPFFTPQATGVIEREQSGKWRFTITSGALEINGIQVAGSTWQGHKTLHVDDSLELP